MVAAKNAVVSTVPRQPGLVAGGSINAIVPQDYDTAYRMAALIHTAGMAPTSLNSTEKCCVAIMHGLEIGLTPMAALQTIAVINNRPTIWGDGLVALVRGSGLLEDLEDKLEVDDKGQPTLAWCKVKRRGEASSHERSLTWVECVKAGWTKKDGPWQLTPGRMMTVRVRGWLFRDVFADVLKGLHSAEEVMDMVDVTAAGSATTAEPQRKDFVRAEGTTASGTASAAASPHSEPAADGQAGGAEASSGQAGTTDAMTFETYKKTSDFVEFSDHFLHNTTPDGAKQWGAFYVDALTFMRDHAKPAMVEAFKGLADLYKELTKVDLLPKAAD